MKVWMIAITTLILGAAGGLIFAQERRVNPQPWELFEPAPHRPGEPEPPIGRYQAVTDGAGGLLIIDTRNTYIIKHVIKHPEGWEVKYDAMELNARH